jgi:hypothetical protein
MAETRRTTSAQRISRPHASGRGEIGLVLEGIGDDKIRVNSSSLDHPLTMMSLGIIVGRLRGVACWSNLQAVFTLWWRRIRFRYELERLTECRFGRPGPRNRGDRQEGHGGARDALGRVDWSRRGTVGPSETALRRWKRAFYKVQLLGRAECGLVGSLEQREQYLYNFLGRDSAVEVLVDHDKLLGVGQADRDYHPSASLELVD